MPMIHVNLDHANMQAPSWDFLACQKLHPELYFSGEVIDRLEPGFLTNLRQTMQEQAFSPVVHAPFYDLTFGARDPQVRRLAADRLRWAIEAAATLGAAQVTVHPGLGPWVLASGFEGWLERARPSLTELVALAGGKNVRLAFENIYDTHPDELAAILEAFPQTHVGVCFDIGHFNLFSQASLKVWLDTLGARLFECHLHDNFGNVDDHIAIGDGTVKFGGLLAWVRSREHPPVLTLEMAEKTHVIKSVNRLRQWLAAPAES
jgi:sugar phosphate isomerase/epimerase